MDPDLGRRDFLAAFVQAILLALFPWMRGRPEIAQAASERLIEQAVFKSGQMRLSIGIKGFEVGVSQMEILTNLAKGYVFHYEPEPMSFEPWV